MKRERLDACHDGKQSVHLIEVLAKDDFREKKMDFIHDDILPPGASVGVHLHEGDEEYYYILSGKGVMILDGKRFDVESGDLTAVYPGGTHGLENNSNENLHILVMSVKR